MRQHPDKVNSLSHYGKHPGDRHLVPVIVRVRSSKIQGVECQCNVVVLYVLKVEFISPLVEVCVISTSGSKVRNICK